MGNNILTTLSVLILIILSLATLRDVLAKFNLIPAKEGKWWSKILYGDISKESIINGLGKVNISEEDLKFITEKLKSNKLEKGIIREVFDEIGVSEISVRQRLGKNVTSCNPIPHPGIRLLELILKYTQGDGAFTFSTNLKIESQYYINSMEASHNFADLSIMSSLLIRLLKEEFDKIDFILIPKSGNTLLGQNIAEILNCTSVFCKNRNDNSFVSLDNISPLKTFVTNFEGVSHVLENSKTKKDKLNGVIIDCNSSSGDTLINCLESFNSNLMTLKESCSDFDNINMVNKAFVLFRPIDNIKIHIDNKFEDKGYKCIRYFDLCEKSKETIFNYKKQNVKTKYSYYEQGDKELIESVIEGLDKKTTLNIVYKTFGTN